MKKIILGLFLILGAISFAIPKNLDVNKVKKAGYEITRDEDSAVIFGKATDDAGITVALFIGDTNAKGVSDSIKATAPKNQKFLSSRETKKLISLNTKILNTMDLLIALLLKIQNQKVLLSLFYI